VVTKKELPRICEPWKKLWRIEDKTKTQRTTEPGKTEGKIHQCGSFKEASF